MIAALAARLPMLAAFAILGWIAIAADLASVGGSAGALPAPDLLFCLSAAFAQRRPAATPATLVFLLGLARDSLSAGPFGLGALALTVSVEGARRAAAAARHEGFLFDWGRAAAWAALGAALLWLGLALSFAPRPALFELALRLAATIAAYPLARAALRLAAPLPAPASAPSDQLRFGRRA